MGEYAAELGVFISPDPVMDLGDPQQWNAYAYANSNPTSMSDPSGLLGWGDAWDWVKDKTTSAVNTVKDTVQDFKETLVDTANIVAEKASDVATAVKETMQETFIPAVVSTVKKASETANAVMQNVVDAAEDGISQVKKAGSKILESTKAVRDTALKASIAMWAGAQRLGVGASRWAQRGIDLVARAGASVSNGYASARAWAGTTFSSKGMQSMLRGLANSKIGRSLGYARRIPVLGTAIGFGNDLIQGKTLQYAVIHAAVGLGGTYAGAVIGAGTMGAAGSVVPVAGTAAGVFVGGFAGSVAGAQGADILMEKLEKDIPWLSKDIGWMNLLGFEG